MSRERAGASQRRVLVLRCPEFLARPAGDPGVVPRASRAGDPGTATPGAMARAFEPVVAIVEEFCPQVEVVRPGLAAIAVRGPARYFGGEATLAAKLSEAVTRRGIACQVGVADGLFAADLAARSGPTGLLVPPGQSVQFLAGLPVTVLPFAALEIPDLADLLSRLGIYTLGEFAAVPPAEAASRFGTQGLIAHRLARGLDPRPLAPRPPRVDISAEQPFEPPAEQSEPVVFTAKALADQMHTQLAARGLACVRVRVQVRCADGRELSRLWRHDGLLSALAVAERVRWQLDGWQAEGGITLLRLVPDQLVRATGRQLSLWGDAVASDRVARAALRVQAMLGHAAVTQPALSGGRRPADQAVLVPFGEAPAGPRPVDRPWPGQIPAPAPVTVYPQPLAAKVTDAAGETVTVTGRAQLSAPPAVLATDGEPARAVTNWAGPWPVTERWWDPGRFRRQARLQLVTEDGRAWLAALDDGSWVIEALYQ
jgi:protein ImuB